MDFGRSAFRRIPKPIVLHPFLFAYLPLLTLGAHNIGEVRWQLALRGIIPLAFLALVALLAGYKIFKDWQRAGVVCSVGFLLFFAYGHIYFGLSFPFINKITSGLGLIGNHFILVIICSAILILVILITLRIRLALKSITNFLNVVSLAAFLFPIINIVKFEFQLNRPLSEGSSIQFESTSISSETFQLPDIYYILLDGYGRSDVIKDLYQVDNGRFIDFLRDNNFFIASDSRSNYIQTGLSIASSLNMDYLDSIARAKGEMYEDRLQLARLVRDSEVRKYLEQKGYSFISVSSAYQMTELDDADYYIQSSQFAINPLEGLLMETSGLVAIQDAAMHFGWNPYFPGYIYHREQVLFAFKVLPTLTSYPSPKFVFSHIVSPHPPFVFGPDGEQVSHNNRYNLMDGNAYSGSSDEYLQGYRDQLIFVSAKLEEMIYQILKNSPGDPIIVIQSDHGPGLGLDYQSCEHSDLNERFSIINAYYFRGRIETPLYKNITPVNTFRVIFNEFFNENFDLLPEKSFCSTWATPFDFIEYTD